MMKKLNCEMRWEGGGGEPSLGTGYKDIPLFHFMILKSFLGIKNVIFHWFKVKKKKN